MKPLPVIVLPRAADQESLIRGLYALGYQYGSRADLDEALDAWRGWSGENPERVEYPYITLKDGPAKRIIAYLSAPDKRTIVNSVRHFLAYTRGLPAQPVAPQ